MILGALKLLQPARCETPPMHLLKVVNIVTRIHPLPNADHVRVLKVITRKSYREVPENSLCDVVLRGGIRAQIQTYVTAYWEW